MTANEKEKLYQFVKLCISLTKQGFRFTKQKNERYALTFDKYYSKRLFHYETKTPFVDSIIRISGDNKKNCYQFGQWAGR